MGQKIGRIVTMGFYSDLWFSKAVINNKHLFWNTDGNMNCWVIKLSALPFANFFFWGVSQLLPWLCSMCNVHTTVGWERRDPEVFEKAASQLLFIIFYFTDGLQTNHGSLKLFIIIPPGSLTTWSLEVEGLWYWMVISCFFSVHTIVLVKVYNQQFQRNYSAFMVGLTSWESIS